ncbi:MAG: MerR family transcriptional regulator [Planctomycetota bacterium]|nr:MerR family transcriptional regulator [Planctomycetota bacterium]
MKNSRELNEYLSRIAESAEWGEPGGDGAAVAVPRKLYRVSEIATHMGLTRQTLHNYATIGLITEECRTDGGQRLFDESVFGRLALIQRLKRSYLLHEIRRMLDTAAPLSAAGSVASAAHALPAATQPSLAGARSMMERSQDIASLPHLAAPTPHTTEMATPPHEGAVAQNPEAALIARDESSPEPREKETPADDQPKT